MYNKVHSKMIDANLGYKEMSLQEFIKVNAKGGTLPIDMFGDPDHITKVTIDKAIEYLMSIGGGNVYIPESKLSGALKICVKGSKWRELVVRYEYFWYKFPTGDECRPYVEEDWQAGDVIYNTDIHGSDDKAIGWVCTESGTPGTWVPYLTHKMVYNSSKESLTFCKNNGSIGSNIEDAIIDDIVSRVNKSSIETLDPFLWNADGNEFYQDISIKNLLNFNNPVVTLYLDQRDTKKEKEEILSVYSQMRYSVVGYNTIRFISTENPTIPISVVITGDYKDLIGFDIPVIGGEGKYISQVSKENGNLNVQAKDITDITGHTIITTLESGNDTLRIEDNVIKDTSTLDIYTNRYGVNPKVVSMSEGVISMVFPIQSSDLEVKVVVK